MAKTSARASSSTDPPAAPRAPRAWPFEQAAPDLVTGFGRAHGLAGADFGRTAAAVRAHLGDRRRIEDLLRRLPVLEIVLLEILAELGGRARMEILFDVARARTGCDAKACAAALDDLDRHCLTVPLVTRPSRGEGMKIAALLAPAAEHVAALVQGVSLPAGEPPPDARPAAAAAAHRRDVIVAAGLTAHRPLRYNLDGSPNAGQLARFAKGLAGPDFAIEPLLSEARVHGLLGAIGDNYAPIASALLRFAAAEEDDIAAWLPAAGWTPVEAVVRACVREQIDDEDGLPVIGAPASYQLLSNVAGRRVKGASGVEIFENEGRAWIRRRSAGQGGGDGHVTPSFDVMLGPGADLEIVATIALGCELTRLDRVLTFHITPASVAAAIASGLPAASLVAALERVGRHPIPSNVRAMVDDWIAQRRAASLSRAWLVRVPEPVADALAKGDLAERVLDRPTPGVLAIDPSVRRGEIAKALAKHRVSLGPPIALDEAAAQRDEERYGPEGPWRSRYAGAREPAAKPPARPPPLPIRFEGDPALAERVAAARAAGFPITPRAPLPAPAPRPPAAPVAKPAPAPAAGGTAPLPAPAEPSPERASRAVEAMLGEARAAGLTSEIVGALVSLGTMYVEELPELDRWAARLPPERRASLGDALDSPLALADFLVLAPKARQTVLGKASDLERLLRESARSRDLRRVSPRGAAAIPLVARAAGILAARRAAGGPPSESGGAPAREPPAPPPAGFARQSAEEVLAALRDACAIKAPVRLFVRSGDGVAIHDVTATAIQPRGASSALLAIDPETDQGRVFHVPDVLAVARTLPP